MGPYLPAWRPCGAPKHMTCSIAAAALSPCGQPAIIAIARRPHHLDAFRRAVQAKLDRDGVRAREVRVVRVDEEPRRLGLAAAGLAHSGRRSRDGQRDVVVVVVCALCVRHAEFFLRIVWGEIKKRALGRTLGGRGAARSTRLGIDPL